MSSGGLESRIAAFLEARDQDPELDPEVWAARFGEDAESVLAGIRGALEVVELFGDDIAPALPGHIGPYGVLREIGRGGMGVVYEVEREGRRSALKLLPLAAQAHLRAAARFRREAAILRRLDHDGIVSLEDVGTDPLGPYLVMPLEKGRSLDTLVRQLEREEAVRLIERLARALHAAHEAGVVHRDLKPSNVILREDGTPVLLDFGLVADSSLTTLTATGDVLGTPRYMAPEQVRGEDPDVRTDVYGLGTILYELLCGRPVQPEGSSEEIRRAILRGKRTPARELVPDLPVGLVLILDQALARRPGSRQVSAAALADDLQRWQSGKQVEALPPGRGARVARYLRRRPWIPIAAAVLIAAGGVYEFTRARPCPPETAVARTHAALRAWLRGERPRSAALLAEAIACDPGYRPARVLAAWVRGDPEADDEDDLLRALRLVCADREASAMRALKEAAAVGDPGVLGAWIAGHASRRRDPRRAVEELQRVATTLGDEGVVAADMAQAMMTRNDHQQAVVWATKATEALPHRPISWRVMAEACLRAGHPDRAAVALERYLEIEQNPTRTDRRMQALIFGALERREDERRILTELVEDDPRDGRSWRLLALSYDTDHRIVEAREAYERAVANRGDSTRLTISFANLLLGGDRGQCPSCDAAFEAHPRVMDPLRASRLLLRLIEKTGKLGAYDQQFFQTALKLDDRAPIIDALERITRDLERTPETTSIFGLLRELRQRTPDWEQ